MRNDQLKQMMFEAKIWFDENKYAEYQEMFETNYNHEVNTWTLFDQYIRDIKDYDIIDMIYRPFDNLTMKSKTVTLKLLEL